MTVAHDMKEIICWGVRKAKPPEKKLGILPHQNEFFHQSRLRDTLSEKYSPYLGGRFYLTQIIKFENVPYLGGIFI